MGRRKRSRARQLHTATRIILFLRNDDVKDVEYGRVLIEVRKLKEYTEKVKAFIPIIRAVKGNPCRHKLLVSQFTKMKRNRIDISKVATVRLNTIYYKHFQRYVRTFVDVDWKILMRIVSNFDCFHYKAVYNIIPCDFSCELYCVNFLLYHFCYYFERVFINQKRPINLQSIETSLKLWYKASL